MILNWFCIDVFIPIKQDIYTDEEISEVDKIKLANEGIMDGYEIGTAYYNLNGNTITSLTPKCFIPKGKTNKKYYTEIIFSNGEYALAVGKSSDVYRKINDYALSIPDTSEN